MVYKNNNLEMLSQPSKTQAFNIVTDALAGRDDNAPTHDECQQMAPNQGFVCTSVSSMSGSHSGSLEPYSWPNSGYI